VNVLTALDGHDAADGYDPDAQRSRNGARIRQTVASSISPRALRAPRTSFEASPRSFRAPPSPRRRPDHVVGIEVFAAITTSHSSIAMPLHHMLWPHERYRAIPLARAGARATASMAFPSAPTRRWLDVGYDLAVLYDVSLVYARLLKSACSADRPAATSR
jgi:hypothetical protein